MGIYDRDYMKSEVGHEFNQKRAIKFLPSGNHLYLHFIVSLHWIIVLANLSAMVVIPILCLMGHVAWYIAFPVVTYLSQLACTRIDCPFTNYENKIRKKLGKPPIDGFIKHYFYVPYLRAKRKAKKQ